MKIRDLTKYINLYNIEKYLFTEISTAARNRKPAYLKFDEFYEICMWKSARPKKLQSENKDVIEKITKDAFARKTEEEKMNMLCKLRGVGIPTASAILTVLYPERYAVIDVRCLEILREKFNQEISQSISLKTWLKYLDIMRKWAKENNTTPRKLDMALFAMHREKLKKENRNLYK